jgi:hypothetical protein
MRTHNLINMVCDLSLLAKRPPTCQRMCSRHASRKALNKSTHKKRTHLCSVATCQTVPCLCCTALICYAQTSRAQVQVIFTHVSRVCRRVRLPRSSIVRTFQETDTSKLATAHDSAIECQNNTPHIYTHPHTSTKIPCSYVPRRYRSTRFAARKCWSDGCAMCLLNSPTANARSGRV